MEEKYSSDWWRWQMYRMLADLLHDPNDLTEARITSLIREYRKFSAQSAQVSSDEHEWLMDFR